MEYKNITLSIVPCGPAAHGWKKEGDIIVIVIYAMNEIQECMWYYSLCDMCD